MKFMRRPDLDPQTRIQMVMTAWLHQGVYFDCLYGLT